MKKYNIEDYKFIINKKYNTNNVDVEINSDPRATRIIFNCDEHGISIWRWQHVKTGKTQNLCKECSYINKGLNFLEETLKKRGFKITSGDYKGAKSKMVVNCIKHNIDVEINRNDFLCGKRVCPVCSKEKWREINKINFIHKANIVHNNFYKYDNITYQTTRELIDILCPNHGIFQQSPDAHSRGQKCPKCAMSIREQYIKDVLEKHKIDFIYNKGHKLLINPETNYPLKPDFWLKKYNLIIEYDGIQHFKQIYSEMEFQKIKRLDLLKNKLCKDNKIRIWRFNKDNVSCFEQKLINLYEKEDPTK
jgi:hypothetical protein